MGFFSILTNYITQSNLITIIVLMWLSIYFIATFWVAISRYLFIYSIYKKDRASLDFLVLGNETVDQASALYIYADKPIKKSMLNICLVNLQKSMTDQLYILSFIASTAPFIGLFGTIVAILEVFNGLSGSSTTTLNIVAPGISEALIATAAGILVSIPAYSFHAILRRKGLEVMFLIQRQVDILVSMPK